MHHGTWDKGGAFAFTMANDDQVVLRSTIPSAPGSRIDGRLPSGVAVRVKIHRCKRQNDGTFVLEGRLLDATRDVRTAIAELVPPPRDGAGGPGDG